MRKPVLILALLVFQFATLFAQNTLVMMKKIVYKSLGNRELSVDLFYTISTQQKSDNTAIAFFHGGGWVFGDPAEFHEACRRFARKGFVTFSFQYRLSRNEDGSYPHPEITPVESTKDARTAIRWLRENAGLLKLNPDKIVAAGQSAGGQLVLATALLDSINEVTDNIKSAPCRMHCCFIPAT